MIDKYCILIDERDQSSNLRGIKRTLSANHGINLIYEQLNPSESKFQSIARDSDIPRVDLEKIGNALSAIPYFRRADALAIDYNLIENDLNGFQVAILVRELGFKGSKKIMLYSAGIERAIDSILSNGDLKAKQSSIARLVKGNIDFVKRDDYESEIINLIKKDPVFDFNSELTTWLHKFPGTTYRGLFPKYHGKTYSNIATEIENDTDLSNQFRKLLVEELFSYISIVDELG